MPDETEYTYEKQEEYDTILSTLSEPEKDACDNMAVVDSTRFGMIPDTLHGAFGIKNATLNSLVEKDILESKPLWEFHKEFLDTYGETIEAIRKRTNDGYSNKSMYRLSHSEQSLWDIYFISKNIVESQSSTPSYRFKDPDLRDYLRRLNHQEEENNSIDTSDS